MNMNRSILALVVAIGASAAVAQAAELYDQTVPSTGGYLYFGAGNQPDNFATNTVTDNGSNVTLGLRAAISGSTGYYDVAGPTGTYDVPVGLRPGSTNHAAWDYVFSIDVGTNDITQYIANLTITDNTSTVTGTYNALSLADNDHTGNTANEPNTFHIQQNAENPLFGYNGGVTFNPNALDSYTITLDLRTLTGSEVVTDTINVDAVAPLPASAWSGLALFGVLAAVGGMKRMRRQEA
jgi:hypothetical protein